MYKELRERIEKVITPNLIHKIHVDLNGSEDHTTFIDAKYDWVNSIANDLTEALKPDENTSDGYHTFKELYDFRLALNANLFNTWGAFDNEIGRRLNVCNEVFKSKKHHDGEEPFGGGSFIVVAETKLGQISFHYELKHWDLFQIPEKEKANKWDGHTPQESLKRLFILASMN